MVTDVLFFLFDHMVVNGQCFKLWIGFASECVIGYLSSLGNKPEVVFIYYQLSLIISFGLDVLVSMPPVHFTDLSSTHAVRDWS